MFFKNILFDLDNTIYDYDFCHSKSINIIFEELSIITKKDINELYNLYMSINNKLKYELKNTASSHNKFIYIKHLLELLKLDLSYSLYYENLYWNNFYENMICFNGVLKLLKWLKLENIKIAIITDYETEHQIKKLKKLNILSYIDYIITSEEVGIEKPSKLIYLYALNKLNCKTDEVIMIGDNFNKDIMGAMNLDILTFWFNRNSKIFFHKNNSYFEFNSFEKLLLHFNNYKTELKKLKYISKYCGERFDLTQAGGGNTSVKYDDIMFIKASGFHLTQINENNGYVLIDNKILKNDIFNNNIKNITSYNVFGKLRGSIETYMHSILKKYTIHLHPIQINKILVSKNCDNFINKFFSNCLLIDYYTPGINICNEIIKLYNNEEIIFLKNHGIIITSDIYENIISTLECVLKTFEQKQILNFEKYKFVNKISNIVNKSYYDKISYLCQDKIINNYLIVKKELFLEKITFPDALIFCGIKILFIDNLDGLNKYFDIYREYPKVLIINKLIYIINISIQKCKDTEDVLKANLMILDSNIEKTYLSNKEIFFLNNWDAENYRKL